MTVEICKVESWALQFQKTVLRTGGGSMKGTHQSCCDNSKHHFIACIVKDVKIIFDQNIERFNTRYSRVKNCFRQRRIWTRKISRKNRCLGIGIKCGNSTNPEISSIE